jgi:HSP20 family protein
MNSLIKRKRNQLMRPSLLFDNPIDRIFRSNFDWWDGDTLEMTVPAINIQEDKKDYRIELAAPGLNKDDFQIDVEGNMMTISCEKETETKEPKNDNYTRREYNYSTFTRSFTLPDNADTDKVSAKYADGVLNLTVPKKEGAQLEKGHKVKVQ